MQKTTFHLLFFFLLTSLNSQAQELLETQLFELPDLIFKKMDTPPDGFEAGYELQIKQALDHKHPEKGYFYQRAFLSHNGFDRPMVIATEGYHRPHNRIYELTNLLNANQLDVEHRFFGTSLPDSMDYRYLNFEQMAADLHKIDTLFKKIYGGKWVSTGISKGGTSTIFYRYFYPEDVDVSVPYVAPVNYEKEDKRIYEFLKKVGSKECRQAILDYQIRLLKNREKVLPLLRWYGKGANLQFSYLTLEEAFEYAVLEYSFSFWQMGHDCSEIPSKSAKLEEDLDHLMEVVGISFFSDKDIDYYSSSYYQFATEMGYYGYETEPFKGLLKVLPANQNPSAAFVPGHMQTTFDGTLANEVASWLKVKGNNFIYIYGGNDTWSATMVPPSDKVNSLWIVLKGKGHGQARIANMTEAEKQKLVSTLEKWLAIDISEN